MVWIQLPMRVEALDEARLDLLQHHADVAFARGVADHLAGGREHPHLLGEGLALDGDDQGPGGLGGVPVEDPAVRLVGTAAVGRAVDGQRAAQHAVGVVERGDQQVHRLPGVRVLDRLDVGHPAPALDLRVEALLRHELEVAPVLGDLELLHQPGDRREGAQQRVARLVAARDRHHLHVLGVPDDAERRHLEAGQLDESLGDDLQRAVREVVGPARRLVHADASAVASTADSARGSVGMGILGRRERELQSGYALVNAVSGDCVTLPRPGATRLVWTARRCRSGRPAPLR